MSVVGLDAAPDHAAVWPHPDDAPLSGYVTRSADGACSLSLLVAGAHCGACIHRIETGLSGIDGVTTARLNLSTRRLAVTWSGAPERASEFVRAVEKLGYDAVPYLPEQLSERDRALDKALLKAFAVAFFATANVMMLSWAVWLGHSGGMGGGTRHFFHWLSATIALPTIAYSGRHFYHSALMALRRGRTNMDVPIALGVLLTTAMSLLETLAGGQHVYFDGALMLLTVLLAGRYLDYRTRARARSAVQQMLLLTTLPVTIRAEDGSLSSRPPSDIRPGEIILVAPGERIGVDGEVLEGTTSVDTSLIDGESLPRTVTTGDEVNAGTANLSQPIAVRARATGSDTALAEIIRLLEAAEQKKGRFVSLADKAVQIYTPAIHLLAALTLCGWMIAGSGWQIALVNAVCVLVIACPCALGLAVPITQVVAAGRLMKSGVLIKSPTALERLASVDTVIFDKTGTLTIGRLVADGSAVPRAIMDMASGLAARSVHPVAVAVRQAAPDAPLVQNVREMPGYGLAADTDEGELRLGSAAYCGAEDNDTASGVWFSGPNMAPVRIPLVDALRPDAAQVVKKLRARGLAVAMLSGDRPYPVAEVAEQLGIADWRAALRPNEKVTHVEALEAQGRKVLMIGDGLNDAAALAAGTASLAPARAAEVSRRSADAIWQGAGLSPVLEILATARAARTIIVQNIGFSFIYNAIWVPAAIFGWVTPWIAAIAMSASSLLVTLNALRLAARHRETR